MDDSFDRKYDNVTWDESGHFDDNINMALQRATGHPKAFVASGDRVGYRVITSKWRALSSFRSPNLCLLYYVRGNVSRLDCLGFRGQLTPPHSLHSIHLATGSHSVYNPITMCTTRRLISNSSHMKL